VPPIEAYFDFMDVGQGDATLIRGPGPAEKLMLVDFGSLKSSRVGPPDAIVFIQGVLTGLGRNKIDHLVLTHGDADHYNQVNKLFRSIPGLTLGEVTVGGSLDSYKGFKKGLMAHKAAGRIGAINELDPNGYFKFSGTPDFDFGDLKIWILAANAFYTHKDPNHNSIVLLCEFGPFKIILAGDATGRVENKILDKKPGTVSLACELLKVPHHGSETSSILKWVNETLPKTIVISSDAREKFGLPRRSVIERYFANLDPLPEHTFVWFDDKGSGKFEEKKTKKAVLGTLVKLLQGAQYQAKLTRMGDDYTINYTTT
jgi:competence protein ComEC